MFFLVIVYTGRGLNLGLEQLRLSENQQIIGPNSAQIQPGSIPKPRCVHADCLQDCKVCQRSVAARGRLYEELCMTSWGRSNSSRGNKWRIYMGSRVTKQKYI